jgi:hypothetical protein
MQPLPDATLAVCGKVLASLRAHSIEVPSAVEQELAADTILHLDKPVDYILV